MLDVLLDDINGVFVARALRSAWPMLPIIFSTGAVPPEEVRKAFDPRITTVLEKPYAIKELLDAIGFVTGA